MRSWREMAERGVEGVVMATYGAKRSKSSKKANEFRGEQQNFDEV